LERVLVNIRRFAILAGLLSGYAVLILAHQAYGLGKILGYFSGNLLLRTGPLALELAVCLALVGLSFNHHYRMVLSHWGESLSKGLAQLGAFNWIGLVVLAILYPLARLGSWADGMDTFVPHIWLFGHLVLLGALALHFGWRKSSTNTCLAIILLAYALVYRVAAFAPQISADPLSLGWSEASRYFYGSLFLAGKVYGQSAPLPVLHPTRYLLQAIPFLISSLPLWFHRLWQVLLWLGLTWAGGAVLARRVVSVPGIGILTGWSRSAVRLLVTAWFFLFAFQGQVYYFLMVCALLILWGFDSQAHWPSGCFWRSLGMLFVASVWAGLSRINWFPVPAVLAVMLYVLERPYPSDSGALSLKTLVRYWIWPVIWVAVGIGVAFGTQAIYIPLSQNPSYMFGSSLTSSLLWYRLWPNATNSQGIVLSLAIVVIPAIWLLGARLLPRLGAWHPLRLLTLGAIIGVFLVGGLVVSVKIGGGGDLHNMDAFLVLLGVLMAYLFFDRFVPDHSEYQTVFKPAWLLVALLLVIPVIPVANLSESLPGYNLAKVDQGLAQLQSALDAAPNQGGEVLFITERQLVTFGTLKNIRLVPEYEKVFLMEMAMANNQTYLDQFLTDLRNHRFSLIVSEVLNNTIHDQNYNFAEENNAWVVHVVRPLLEYYQVEEHSDGMPFELLVPK
jgi:hypothetical protein